MQTYIVPVSVYPSNANVLYIRAGNLGPPPSYYYQLQNVTPGVGGNPDTVVVLKDGNIDMTQAQWTAWPAGANDEEYQLNAISANLGLTRA